MPYDQKQLEDLFLRAKTVLGSDAEQTLISSKQRNDAFLTALLRATKAMGGPDKVTDAQILGALQIAHEVFPVELETLSKTGSKASKFESLMNNMARTKQMPMDLQPISSATPLKRPPQDQ